MTENGQDGCNGWELLEIARNGWNFQEQLDILEMPGYGQNWLEIAGNGRNGWKWLEID